MSCEHESDLHYFCKHRNPVHMRHVVKLAYKFATTVPEDIDPRGFIKAFKPLPKGQYPLFNEYPAFIVDYQVRFFNKLSC